jgi:hypothetical protein
MRSLQGSYCTIKVVQKFSLSEEKVLSGSPWLRLDTRCSNASTCLGRRDHTSHNSALRAAIEWRADAAAQGLLITTHPAVLVWDTALFGTETPLGDGFMDVGIGFRME